VASSTTRPQRFRFTLGEVDAAPLSQLELARLKAKQRAGAAVERVTSEWQPPSFNPRDAIRWTRVALTTELRTWQSVLPTLLRHDFAFTLALWVAVFSVAASVVAAPTVPLSIRYTAGLAAVAYLYLYVELTRMARPVPGRTLLLGIADLAVVSAIGALSVPYVPYARVLLFFAAARAAARWRDARILPAGLLMLMPFELAGHAAPLMMVFDAFLVLMTMVLVMHLMAGLDSAQQTMRRQSSLASLISALARVRDEEALFAQLASYAPALAPTCAWAFWSMDPTGDEYRAVRWAGLPEGEMPGFSFTPTLTAEPGQPVLIHGPLPGTSAGTCTLIQPTMGDGDSNGLITVAGRAGDFDPTVRALIRSVGDEMGATLLRLQSLDDQRQRTEAMEQANRLAGLAAQYALDQAAALAAIRPALASLLRSESLHIEWVQGDRLTLVVGGNDPLEAHAPRWLSLAGTRTAEALLQGRALREPLTGRRPEDLFGVPAGLRQIAVAPLHSAGVDGTLQLGRRLPRAYAAGELLLLQLLAERLGLLFAAGRTPAPVADYDVKGVAA
jgi:hypothetical protein